MNFPTTFENLRSHISEKEAAAQTASNLARYHEGEVRRYGKEQEHHGTIVKILKGLLNSWRTPDPGKYGDVYFFIHSQQQRVVAREFLPPDVRICSHQEWQGYLRNRPSHSADYEMVPPQYPAVPFAEIDKRKCPKCKTLQPIVEHYVQVYDSPEGDEWLRERFILCLDCDQTTTIKSETSDVRIY